MRRARNCVVVGALACALSVSGSARADGSRPDWAFGQPAAETAVGSFAVASNLTFFLPQQTSDWGPSSSRGFDGTADDWSDLFGSIGGAAIATGSGYALESGYLASVGAERPGVQALFTTMVETESLLVTNGITQLIKSLAGRCRPRAYSSRDCTEHDAFPSGHTSAISSFAGARIYRLATTDPDAGIGLRAASLGLAEASTVTVAILRVVAGAHSWEDVLAGAAIGHATGVIVAAMHPSVPVDRRPDVATRERRVFVEWGTEF